MSPWFTRSLALGLCVLPLLTALGCQARQPLPVPTITEAPALYANGIAQQASRDELAHLARRRRMSPAERQADDLHQAREREQREQARLAAIETRDRQHAAARDAEIERQRAERQAAEGHYPPRDEHELLMDFCSKFAQASDAVVTLRALGVPLTNALRLLTPPEQTSVDGKRVTARLILHVYRFPETATARQVSEQLLHDCLLMPEVMTGLPFPASALRY